MVETSPTTKSKIRGKSKGVLINSTWFSNVKRKVLRISITETKAKRIKNFGVSKNSVVRFVNKNRVESRTKYNPALKVKFK